MYKLVNGELPICFDNMFETNNYLHNYNTRFKHHFRVPKHRTCLIRQTIKLKGPEIWNLIPQEIKYAPSVSIFKSKFKSHILS